MSLYTTCHLLHMSCTSYDLSNKFGTIDHLVCWCVSWCCLRLNPCWIKLRGVSVDA